MSTLGIPVPNAQPVEVRRRADGTAQVYVGSERVSNVVDVSCALSIDHVLRVTITVNARDFRVVSEDA